MKKLLITALVALAAPAAMAQANNVGSCGWGSKVFAGQKGVGPQVLAATTNGTSGNQTFGITFGTLGCAKDGVVTSTQKLSVYIDSNRMALARDAAAGQGESLDGLMAVMQVRGEDRAPLASLMRQQFGRVFADEAVVANLKGVLASDARFTGYAAQI